MKPWPLMTLAAPVLLGAGSDMPKLGKPIACTLGKDCAIQNYTDLDPGPAASDFRCGSRTYDGHNGTDFRLHSMDQQRRGVAVLAAADGKVLRVRDGVPDVSVKEAGRSEAVAQAMCGNGLVIEHAGGLETQYCHMAKGSIAVRPGQQVKAGERVGLVGLSGNTEYPHLHMTVRKDGKVVDPFAYGAAPGQCGGGPSLWAADSGLTGAYRPGEVLLTGFSTGPVTVASAREHGEAQQPAPDKSAPALVAFVQAMGLKAGDVQRLIVTGPDGSVLADNRAKPLESDKAEWLIFTGRKRPATGWQAGRYEARYEVVRGGKPLVSERFSVTL